MYLNSDFILGLPIGSELKVECAIECFIVFTTLLSSDW